MDYNNPHFGDIAEVDMVLDPGRPSSYSQLVQYQPRVNAATGMHYKS